MAKKKVFFGSYWLIPLLLFFLSCWSFFLFLYFNHGDVRMSKSGAIIRINVLPSPVESKFFYGVGVDMSQILPNSSHYIINSQGQDLIDIAYHLGITMLRITNSTDGTNTSGIYTKQQWATVLDKMQQKGMRALILVESPSIYQKNIPSTYIPFLQQYVLDSGVLTHSDVYGVDLYNEPADTQANTTLLQKAAGMVKQKSPKTALTVGWWAIDTGKKDDKGKEIYRWDDYGAGRDFDNFVDFYSIHMYGFDVRSTILGKYPDPSAFTSNFINQMKGQLQTQKPLVIEEFGAANGDAISDQDTIGSPEIQANAYGGVYQSLRDMKDPQIAGAIAYQFISRTNSADAWALVKNNGDYIFPAAYILQKYSTGKSDVLISLPLPVTSQDYFFSEQNNGQTVAINKNSMIGLKLSLDKNSTYKILSNNNTAVTLKKPLTYNDSTSLFTAVFRAENAGIATILVEQHTNIEKFRLTLAVIK